MIADSELLTRKLSDYAMPTYAIYKPDSQSTDEFIVVIQASPHPFPSSPSKSLPISAIDSS